MKKLAMTLLAFVLSLTCISGIFAASAETSEIKEAKETTTGEVVKADAWTVTKKYFAASYTMKLTDTAGKHGENGCCGIILGGSDGYACLMIPFDGGYDVDESKLPTCDRDVKFGPWWSNDNGGQYKAKFKFDEKLIGTEATVLVLCSQEGGKLTVDSLYLNGNKLVDGTLIDNDTAVKFEGCTLDNFDGHVGFATKLSGVEYTAKFVESDEKLDEKCFDAKPDTPVDPVDPDPGKKPATTPDTPPKTGTASVVIASVAVISLAGVVIASKKRNQD